MGGEGIMPVKPNQHPFWGGGREVEADLDREGDFNRFQDGVNIRCLRPFFEPAGFDGRQGLRFLTSFRSDSLIILSRHVTGDWGDLGEEDRRENDFSVDRRLRLFSAYHMARGV